MKGTHSLRRQVAVDFLYLDLEVCTRCRGTDLNLDTAPTTIRSEAAAFGMTAPVGKAGSRA